MNNIRWCMTVGCVLTAALFGMATARASSCPLPPDEPDCDQYASLSEADRMRCAVAARHPGDLHFGLALETTDGCRLFHAYQPSTLPATPPLVIILHGGSLSYNSTFNVGEMTVLPDDSVVFSGSTSSSEWLAVAEDEGWLTIAPNGTRPSAVLQCLFDSSYCQEQTLTTNKQHWNDCRGNAGTSTVASDDVAFISDLIDWAAAEYGIDETRVYVTGASNGGMMTYRIGRELPDRVAAIAASIANNPLTLTGNDECIAPVEPVPVMIMNGTLDTVIPWIGGCLTGCVKSAPATRDDWVLWNGASSTPDTTVSYPANPDYPLDASSVSCAVHGGGADAAEVRFCTVSGGGHSEPSRLHPVPPVYALIGLQNRDIETARTFADFFRDKTLLGM